MCVLLISGSLISFYEDLKNSMLESSLLHGHGLHALHVLHGPHDLHGLIRAHVLKREVYLSLPQCRLSSK